MLIHSVTPAHMLTACDDISSQSYKMMVGGSYLEGSQTSDGFKLSRIHSTDPGMYLKENLSPGALLSFEKPSDGSL